MADIFLSHSKDDKEIAIEFSRRCKARGLSVFLDQDAIEPGEDWLKRIHKEVEDCSAFWLLASNRAMASPMVNKEIGAAQAHKVDVIPIVWDMQPDELPNDLQRLQAVVLTNKSEQDVNEQIANLVIRAVRKKMYGQIEIIAIVGVVLAAVFFGGKSGAGS